MVQANFTFSATYFAEVVPKCDASNRKQCSATSKTACEAKGCCWESSGSPNCFYLPGMLGKFHIHKECSCSRGPS